MARYATVEELKGHVRIDDAIDDIQLGFALDAAEQAVDDFCRRTFDTINTEDDAAKTSRIYDPATETPSGNTVSLSRATPVYLDDVAAIDTIETKTTPTGDWTAVDTDDWEARPLNASAESRPFTHVIFHKRLSVHRFQVTAWFGWPATPDTVKQATLLQAARFAQRRNASFGIATLSDMDGTGMRLLSKLDADVELLLAPLRRHQVLVA